MLPKYSFTIMVIIFLNKGDPTVGKSNITSRFIHDDFSDDYNPTL
jgi:GTPase SAR1 family protein